MSSKLLLILFCIVLSEILTDCQNIKSDSKQNSEKINKSIEKQWSEWPSGQSHTNQWPNSKWNASQWPTGVWRPPISPGVWPPRPSIPSSSNPSTIYPPLPDYTVNWPIRTTTTSTNDQTSSQPVMEETTPSIPQRPQTTPKRPSQQQTQRPTRLPTASPSEESSSLTVKSCGLSHIPHEFNGNKIVSGKIAKSGEFPWQVILKINTAKGNMQCGGAILNSKWILTAAHCVSNERDGTPTAQRIDITAGVHNRLQMSAASQQKTADCVIQHESWRGQSGNFKNDIALLRLPNNNQFEITYDRGGHVNGICLPQKSMSEYSGKARIAGWGLTKDRGTPSDVLLYTDVSIITNDKCRQFQYPVPIADSMICQGVDRKAPCQGDSGGALIIPISDSRGVQRMTEVGIVSFGPGKCANSETPNAIYTKVSHFLKWIEKTIQANEQRCARPLRTGAIHKIEDILNENIINSTIIVQNIV